MCDPNEKQRELFNLIRNMFIDIKSRTASFFPKPNAGSLQCDPSIWKTNHIK